MKKSLILALIVACTFNVNNVFAQSVCDETLLDQCKAACVTAQPACTTPPLLTISDIRAIIAEKCGCAVTEGTTADTCTCTDKVKNYGNYRSCVAQLSDSLKTFKLSSQTAKDQLKADNSLCKSVINGNKGGGKGNGNNGGKKE
jgi:hypothetical protein